MAFLETNRTAVEQRFAAAWDLGGGVLRTPIDFEGVEKSAGLITVADGSQMIPAPPHDAPWVRVSLRHMASVQKDLADHPRMRHTGTIYVDVFAPVAGGTVVADQLADAALGIFERGEFAGLHCRASDPIELPEDGHWCHRQIMVPFYADRIAA